jgi:hypothetical protein
MRRTLRKWSDLSGIPNPYEYSPDLEQVTERSTDHVEWEPLPGHASTPDGASTPSSDEVTLNPPQPLPIVTPNNSKTTPSPPSTDPEQKLSGKPSPPMSPGEAQPEALPGLTDIPTPVLSSTLKGTNRSDSPSSSMRDRKATQLKAARNLVKRANEQRKKPTSAKALDSTRKPTPAKNSNSTRPTDDLVPEKRNYTATERLKGFFRALF